MELRIEVLPLLSVIIATRNRIPYAISAIQSILEISDPRLELVVQDNSDSRELESYVQLNLKDNRFHYRYTPPPFSSIDNFNAAVELANGEYLCLIGDDDGINPEIIEAAAWAQANDLDALTSRNISHYLWPNSGTPSTLFTKVEGGELSITKFSGKIAKVDLRHEVFKLIRNGGVYYLSFKLPKLYHGLIHRRCMNRIHENTGAYFGGLSPDIFAVLAISEVAERVMFIDYPLTIPGVCKASASVLEGHNKKNTIRLEDAIQFRDRGEYHWCELVPRVFTAETIWVDSGVAALRVMGRNDLVRELNLPKLAAFCICANRGVTGPVLRDMFIGMRRMGKSPVICAIQFAWSLLTGPGIRLVRRAWNRFQIICAMKFIHIIYGLDNMAEASHALTSYLKKSSQSFAECVREKRV